MTKLLATTTFLLTLLVSPLMALEGKGLVCKCVKCDEFLPKENTPNKLFQFGAEKVIKFSLALRNDKYSLVTSPSWDNYGRSSRAIAWWSMAQTFYYTLNRENLELEEKYSKEEYHIYKCTVYDPSSFKEELNKFKSYYQSEYDKGRKKNKI